MATLNFEYILSLGRITLPLPITKIDGVKCSAYLENVSLMASTNPPIVRLRVCPENSMTTTRLCENQKEFEELIEILKNFRFDKIQNRFIDGTKFEPQPLEFYKCIESPTIKMSEECCVCLEPTSGEIYSCNHPICMQCLSQLKTRKCPMCRQHIFTKEEMEEFD